MLKKELIEAINVFLVNSDLVDIRVSDDEFEVRFASKKEQATIPIVISEPQSLVDNNIPIKSDQINALPADDISQPTEVDEVKISGEDPIIPSQEENKIIWPRGKRPSSDIEWFKTALTQYIDENPNKNQNEIAAEFGITNTTVFKYLKEFNIPYISKPGGWITGKEKKRIFKTDQKLNEAIAPQKAITIEHDLKDFTQGNDLKDFDMPNHLKKELHEMVRNAVLNINMAQAEALELKSKFDSFGKNGNLITSSLGIWVLKPLNGSDSHLEFAGLATSAQYQLFPRWEIGKSYCILQFYGNIKTVEYVVSVHNGQMRVNRRS